MRLLASRKQQVSEIYRTKTTRLDLNQKKLASLPAIFWQVENQRILAIRNRSLITVSEKRKIDKKHLSSLLRPTTVLIDSAS